MRWCQTRKVSLYQMKVGIQHVIELSRSSYKCDDLNASTIQETSQNMPAQATSGPDDKNFFHCRID